MKSLAIEALLLSALVCANSAACLARWPDNVGFWVIGNRATRTCEIVTSNPILPDSIFWFQSGPYRSLDDAKLARSTISACPMSD
ncbi:MAG: hypothetical protein ACLP1D_27585 [Xanthobacteraceae bacterium]